MDGGLSQPPPPYNPAGPTHINQRWVAPGHSIREPGPPDPRFPHHGVAGPIRLPHEGARIPVPCGSGRFSRGYVPGGPNSRMPMYHGPNIPPGMVPKSHMSRLTQPHPIGPANEAYPFSEKLKEQASIYRSEGMHNQPGPMFDPNNPVDPMMGPRMGSPEWPPYQSNQIPLSRGLMPPEGMSPTCSAIGTGPMMVTSMAGQVLESGLQPGMDPPMDPNLPMHLNNTGMPSSYNMTSFVKGSASLPTYPSSSMANIPPIKSFPNQDMRPSSGNVPGVVNQPPMDGSSGMMGDTMARRGESRPPDLNINAAMARSSPSFHGGEIIVINV